jgi:hypothetical protein
MDSPDLAAWLHEQLDADESDARDLAAEATRCKLALRETRLLGTTQIGWGNWSAVERTAVQVLADIAAKRAILGLHCTRSGTGGTWDTDPVAICNDCSDVQPCMTLRLIASAYSGRPGYRDEWRVDGFGGTRSCIE